MKISQLPTWGQLAEEICQLRKGAEMSQVSLGNIAGYLSSPNASISRIESCKVQIPPAKFALIARHFGLTPESLARQAAKNEIEMDPKPELKSFRYQMVTQSFIDEATAFLNDTNDEPSSVDDWASELEDRTNLLNAKLENAFEEWQAAAAAMDTNVLSKVLTFLRETKPDILDSSSSNQNKLPSNKTEELSLFEFTQQGVDRLLAEVASPSAIGIAAGAGVAGSVYSAVAVFGTASTGVAIGSLSGVAMTNATLAALGGGSLAAGGAGMLGGTILLGTLFGIPTLLGASYSIFKLIKLKHEREQKIRTELRKAEQQLEEAEKRVEKAITASGELISLMKNLEQLCMDLFILQAKLGADSNANSWKRFHDVLIFGNYLTFIPVWSLTGEPKQVLDEGPNWSEDKIEKEIMKAKSHFAELSA